MTGSSGSPSTSASKSEDNIENRSSGRPAGGRADVFSDRIVALVIFSILHSAVGIASGVLVAALLGPAGKGEYHLLLLVPTTVVVLMQLGLPSAFSFYSAKGRTGGLVLRAVVLGVTLSATAVAGTLLLLPLLQSAVLRGINGTLIVLGMLTVPFALTSTFLTGVVLGRQAVGWSISANAITSIVSLLLLIGLVGGAGMGVTGAVVAVLGGRATQFLAFLFGATAVTRGPRADEDVTSKTLFRYGFPLYPGSVTLFFGYRFDVYLLAWLLTDPAVGLGYYSMAVSMSEMSLMIPNAVMTLFFPYVAGATRDSSTRNLGLTSRVTLALTSVAAVGIVPAATLLILTVLPDFRPALPALFILLGSAVALGASKVASAYLLGIGRTSLISGINVAAFALNVALNFILIPRYGIVGAAWASLLSYVAAAVGFSAAASKHARVRIDELWIPRLSDVSFIFSTSRNLVRRAVLGRRHVDKRAG